MCLRLSYDFTDVNKSTVKCKSRLSMPYLHKFLRFALVFSQPSQRTSTTAAPATTAAAPATTTAVGRFFGTSRRGRAARQPIQHVLRHQWGVVRSAPEQVGRRERRQRAVAAFDWVTKSAAPSKMSVRTSFRFRQINLENTSDSVVNNES